MLHRQWALFCYYTTATFSYVIESFKINYFHYMYCRSTGNLKEGICRKYFYGIETCFMDHQIEKRFFL